jgi:UDP-2,4-diacetamido-2,4,6-trideoxy-beta-L-altropyranose hydrolase
MTAFCRAVAFRVDASLQIGSGHLVRCLTLADALHAEGVDCHFITRAHDAVATRLLNGCPHTVHWLPPGMPPESWHDLAHAQWLGAPWQLDAQETAEVLQANPIDWLIVDHYALDARWESEIEVSHLLVIDDLADRKHHCCLLLDANFGRRPEQHLSWLPAATSLLLGPEYALLRPEFAQRREAAGARISRERVSQVLIAFGGTDRDDVTCQLIQALAENIAEPDWHLDVVIGAGNPHVHTVSQALSAWGGSSQLTVAAEDLAERMLMADLSFGAAGTMAWERCCLGLPTLQLCLADNQQHALEALESAGAAQTLTGPQDAPAWLMKLNDHPQTLAMMSVAAADLVDGRGTQRVVQAMASYQGGVHK